MKRAIGLALVLGSLWGCAETKGVAKGVASQACHDSCSAGRQRCEFDVNAKTGGNHDGLDGAGKALAQKEGLAACASAYTRCIGHCS